MSDANTPSPSNLPCSTTGTSAISRCRCDNNTDILTRNPVSMRNVLKPKVPSSLSEWQLMAVLHRANLLQYFETFIAQGGDDINQIMQCDEEEFLEIMSLVGMLSKPLHVRRFQRTLTDFSKDPSAFNLNAMQQIGPPPMPTFPAGANVMDILLPGTAQAFFNSTSTSGSPLVLPPSEIPSSSLTSSSISSFTTTPSITSTLTTSPSASASLAASQAALSCAIDLTALSTSSNLLAEEYLQSLVAANTSAAPHLFSGRESVTINTANSKEATSQGKGLRATLLKTEETSSFTRRSPFIQPVEDFVSLGDYDPNQCNNETPVLSDAQVIRLTACAVAVVGRLPQYAPKLVQNKKKISKELLDVMSLPPTQPNRLEEYRKYSAIYGRFDAKRKADKCLTLHEVSVNEAAAQICLLRPALLTRRDELFTLARQVVKDAGYHYAKKERKRQLDETSPRSSPSLSPPPSLVDEDDTLSTGSMSEEKRRKRTQSESEAFPDVLKNSNRIKYFNQK